MAPIVSGLFLILMESPARIWPVPSILPRYVLREVLKMYGAGLALMFALQMADTLSSTVGKALSYHASAAEAGAAFLAILPSIVNRSLVLAVPFAILLGLSRLQKDSELKASLAAGVRPLSLALPLLLPFALVGLVAFWNAGTVVPAGLDKWDKTWYGIFGMSAPIPSRDNYTYAPPGALYYAGRVTGQSEMLTASTKKWSGEVVSFTENRTTRSRRVGSGWDSAMASCPSVFWARAPAGSRCGSTPCSVRSRSRAPRRRFRVRGVVIQSSVVCMSPPGWGALRWGRDSFADYELT